MTLPVTLPPIVPIQAVTVGELATKVKFPALANVPKVGVSLPIRFKVLPKVKVCPVLLSVMLLSELADELVWVIYILFVIAPDPAILKDETEEPVKLPLAAEVGKTIAPFNVKVCPFKFKIPLVCVNVPDKVKAVPNVNVCPLLLNVKLFNVSAPVVKNKLLLMLVAEIDRLDVFVPVMVPLVEDTGKTTVPLRVSVCAFNLRIPAVCVKAPDTVSAVPSVNVLPVLFNVKLFSV